MSGLYGGWTLESWEKALFDLTYGQHGGSGLRHGYRDVLAMPVTTIRRQLEHLEEARDAEAKAIRRANGVR